MSCVVLHPGTGSIKLGVSGDTEPRAMYEYILFLIFHLFSRRFSTVVGRQMHQMLPAIKGWQGAQVFVGDAAQNLRGVLQLKYPMEHGNIVNRDRIAACAFQ